MLPHIIIPARAGSKGVKHKNFRDIAGRPLIYWTIEAALKSEVTRDIYVTTDCPDISSYCSSLGVSVLDRPPELASDTATTVDVIRYIYQYQISPNNDQAIILLQPTSPFRTAQDIQESWELYQQYDHTYSLISVYKVEDCHPARMYTIENKLLEPYIPSHSYLSRQQLPDAYHRNGAIYITPFSTIVQGLMWSPKIIPFFMPYLRSLNIDTEDDLLLAQLYKSYLAKL